MATGGQSLPEISTASPDEDATDRTNALPGNTTDPPGEVPPLAGSCTTTNPGWRALKWLQTIQTSLGKFTLTSNNPAADFIDNKKETEEVQDNGGLDISTKVSRKPCASIITDTLKAEDMLESLGCPPSLGPAAIEPSLLENSIAVPSEDATDRTNALPGNTTDPPREVPPPAGSCTTTNPGCPPLKRRRVSTNINYSTHVAFIFDDDVTFSAFSELALGTDGMGQGWSAAQLNNAKFEYSLDNRMWQHAATVDLQDDQVAEMTKAQTITARYWRLARSTYLGRISLGI